MIPLEKVYIANHIDCVLYVLHSYADLRRHGYMALLLTPPSDQPAFAVISCGAAAERHIESTRPFYPGVKGNT
jgi:hypothetical protein